jgi:N-glycosylase/DNA lyase
VPVNKSEQQTAGKSIQMNAQTTVQAALVQSNGVQIEADCFDLEQIMESGQCFRIYRVSENEVNHGTDLTAGNINESVNFGTLYRATAADHTVLIRQEGKNISSHHEKLQNNLHLITFLCPPDEYEHFWCHYFDLETDYRQYETAIDPADSYLKSAFAFGSGIRILNQDPWEMLITFIISQRKNIPAIRQAVEALSKKCGTCIDKENQIYAFPTPAQLSALTLSDLQSLSLGYRAKYIYETTKQVVDGSLALTQWDILSDDDMHKMLLSCYGVGEKVANCVALFGYHRIGAFPVDVWIDRIQKTYYNGHFPVEKYEGFAGIMQQYLFYYERKKDS